MTAGAQNPQSWVTYSYSHKMRLERALYRAPRGLILFKSVAHRMYSISASVLAPNLKLAPTLNNMHPPYRQEKLISALPRISTNLRVTLPK